MALVEIIMFAILSSLNRKKISEVLMKKKLLTFAILTLLTGTFSTLAEAADTASVSDHPAATLSAVTGTVNGPASTGGNTLEAIAQQQSDLMDRQQIKELVDRFSILADEKDGLSQAQLFTKDAQVDNYKDGKHNGHIEGNTNIAKVYDDFLKSQDVVYHINGQQVVRLNGDNTADGISYCYVVLIDTVNGKRVKRTQGVRYVDNYKRVGGQWLINSRKAFFEWVEYEPLNESPIQA